MALRGDWKELLPRKETAEMQSVDEDLRVIAMNVGAAQRSVSDLRDPEGDVHLEVALLDLRRFGNIIARAAEDTLILMKSDLHRPEDGEDYIPPARRRGV